MKKRFITFCFILIGAAVSAQPTSDELTKLLESYNSVWERAKIAVSLNQEKFASGDTVYFKIYFLTHDLAPITDIQLIDVNLVDVKGKSKAHFLSKLFNGAGNNQMVIPDGLDEGIYLLTFHSNWGRNFSPVLMCSKQIEIVKSNSLIAEEDIRLGVEGGHFVKDVDNSIFINAIGNSQLSLMNQQGEILTKATTDGNGNAVLTVRPAAGQKYYIKGRVSRELPPVEPDGISLRMEQTNGARKIYLECPDQSGYRNSRLSAILSGNNRVVSSASLNLPSGKTSIDVPGDLPDGLYDISVLDGAFNVIAFRKFFHHSANKVRTALAFEKEVFQPREKVVVRISVTDDTGKGIAGEFAVSAVNAFLIGQPRTTLLNDLTFFGETNSILKVDQSDLQWESVVNNFLIASMNELPWKKIIDRSGGKPLYGFKNTIQRKGIAFDNKGQPLADNSKVLFYLQKDMLHYQTFTTNNGHVQLTIPDIYGDDEFFYLAEEQYFDKEIDGVSVKWESDSISLPAAPLSTVSGDKDPYADYVSKRRLIDRSYNFYGKAKSGPVSASSKTPFELEVAEADVVINVDDYNPFATMTDLVKEVIPSLRRRTRGKKDVVMVSLSEPMKMPVSDPVYIIDGIASRNTEFFLALKPSEVVSVKVINSTKKLQPLGLLGKYGIVIVQTRSGNSYPLTGEASKRVGGINLPVTFPSHAPSDMHIPDFRTTVYWNPSVKTDANGNATVEFYCSDDVGEIRLRVEGLANHQVFSSQKIITVSIPVNNK